MQAWDLFKKAYGTSLDQSQVINWMWYDTQTYTSGATTLLTFFNAVRATKDLGNMELAGVLAHPKAFIVRATRIHVKNVPVQDDGALPVAWSNIQLLQTGWCQFEVGNKNYGIWPIHALPGGSGVYAEAAAAGGEAGDEFLTYGTNGPPDCRAVYTLSQPLLIDPQINFNLTLHWTTAVTLVADTPIMVMLDGELMRPVQ